MIAFVPRLYSRAERYLHVPVLCIAFPTLTSLSVSMISAVACAQRQVAQGPTFSLDFLGLKGECSCIANFQVLPPEWVRAVLTFSLFASSLCS